MGVGLRHYYRFTPRLRYNTRVPEGSGVLLVSCSDGALGSELWQCCFVAALALGRTRP